MVSSPEEKLIYQDIQKKLFYIVPEKWDAIYLYASVIEVPNQKPVGEMYFYYLPKGIIKKKPVNGYEIPNLFNIDEEQYSKLITDVYNSIKLLRECTINKKKKVWSNISISISNFQFRIEFDYEDLNNSEFDSYERHVVWRYRYLNEDIKYMGKKDKKIINTYNEYIKTHPEPKRDYYIEGIYKQPIKNIIDYEKTLTVEEAIAQSKSQENGEKKKKKSLLKKHKIDDVIDDNSDNRVYNNQILNQKK